MESKFCSWGSHVPFQRFLGMPLSEDTLFFPSAQGAKSLWGSTVSPTRAQAVASAYRKGWRGGLWGSQQVCCGLLANIIFTGQMFSAGGERNNNCAGTPHFHGWRVASTKSTAFFLVCTRILPAWSVAEGYPGSTQKRERVCVCICAGEREKERV